jgi:hypothetical protein
MQTKVLKILLIMFFPLFCLAQINRQKIARADSLFRTKQFTQSFTIYQALLAQNQYSPAMLLKMAFIQEGLGHQGLCLYYLNLYQQVSDDHQAATKMEDLANKHRLEGYQSSDGSRVMHFFQKNNLRIVALLSVIIFFFFALLFYQKRKGDGVVATVLLIAFFSVSLFAVANWGGKPSQVIISSGTTYLMSGPSAGASVISILDEGHRLTVQSEKDVWLKVKWKEKDAYVKKNNVLSIRL